MKLFVFQFGPLVMRLLHRMKKADVAYTAVENEVNAVAVTIEVFLCKSM